MRHDPLQSSLDLEDRSRLASGNWSRCCRSSDDLRGLGDDHHLLLAAPHLVDGWLRRIGIPELELTRLLAQGTGSAEAVRAAVIAWLEQKSSEKTGEGASQRFEHNSEGSLVLNVVPERGGCRFDELSFCYPTRRTEWQDRTKPASRRREGMERSSPLRWWRTC